MAKTGKLLKNIGKRPVVQQLGRWIRQLLVLCVQVSLLMVCLYRVLPVPVTPLHLIRLWEQRSDGKDMKLKKEWHNLSTMSPNMPLAVVSSEDPLFFDHFGFDFEQIRNSLERNMEDGKKLRGASTISQQTAKNLFLWPARSWLRKGIEVYCTLLLEGFWNKKRILEVYLNIIEMGDGIYGAEAAAQSYFKKPAEELTRGEAALIAAVLPNPRRWHPDKPTAYILKKKSRIMHFMHYVDMSRLHPEGDTRDETKDKRKK